MELIPPQECEVEISKGIIGIWRLGMKELKKALRIAKELSELTDTLIKIVKEVAELEEKESTEGSSTREEKKNNMDICEVRNILATIGRRDKKEQIRALIHEFGGKKLTDLKAECYEELVERARGL